MTSRRDIILGGASLAAAGLAYALKPHQRRSLLSNQKMAKIVPTTFGSWVSEDDEGLVKPETEGKLAARLYSEIVQRIYRNTATGEEIMMLIAFGDTQSDLLQLHRPESCYPAVGFELLSTKRAAVALAPAVLLPGRRVIAAKGERVENIFYWTRLGEHLPASAGDQREARLLTAMQGYIPDGGLFRFSVLGRAPAVAFGVIDGLVSDLVRSVAPANRPALVTTALARRLAP
jgi:EpsI family protein